MRTCFKNLGNTTSRSEPDVADISLALQLDGFHQVWAKQMKESLILVILVDHQNPAIFIAFKSQHEGLVKVDAGSFARRAEQLLGDVFKDSPSGNDIILDVNQNMKRFIQASSFVDNFKRLFAFLELVFILTSSDFKTISLYM